MSNLIKSNGRKILMGRKEEREVKIFPLEVIRVEKVDSLDAFKAKMMDFRALRPAVLANG